MTSEALRHRAEVTAAAVERARGRLGEAKAAILADEGDTVGAWCDVLHALESAAELAHAVAALPVEAIAPPAPGYAAPASVTLLVDGRPVIYTPP